VPTADAAVFPGGRGYITAFGMPGPVFSVLGREPKAVIKKFTTAMPQRFAVSKNEVQLCGALFDIDEATGKTKKAQRIQVR
jgi:calcineurin-like phosphoesterase